MPKRSFAAMLLAVALLGAPGAAVAAPAPAATNGEILFMRWVDDGHRLLRISPDGTDRREITRLPSQPQLRPIGVSPEGRRLAWWRSEPGQPRSQNLLLVSNADGTALAEIAPFDDIAHHPTAAWSPDGLELAVVDRNRLYLVPADGSSAPARRPRNLPLGDITEVQWEPDGQRILLTVWTHDAYGNTQHVLWSVDRDGGDHRQILTLDREDLYVSRTRISPDGRSLAYIGDDGTGYIDCSPHELGVFDLATGDRRTVVAPGNFHCGARHLAWSPDGRHVVIEAYEYDVGIRLHRADVADGSLTKLTNPAVGISDTLVAWRPVPDLLARACPAGGVPEGGFRDTAGTAHARGIDCAAWWEIAAGRTDGTYGPGAPVTRAQMASFVARALEAAGVELPEVSGSRFEDVDVTSAHGRRIEQLAEVGLVDGVAPGRYAPERAVTRAQMARFLVGAYELATGQRLPTLPDAFVDDEGIALEPSVNAASSVGLASGVEASRYAPGDAVNRGQMATFLSRLVDRLARDLDLPPR